MNSKKKKLENESTDRRPEGWVHVLGGSSCPIVRRRVVREPGGARQVNKEDAVPLRKSRLVTRIRASEASGFGLGITHILTPLSRTVTGPRSQAKGSPPSLVSFESNIH